MADSRAQADAIPTGSRRGAQRAALPTNKFATATKPVDPLAHRHGPKAICCAACLVALCEVVTPGSGDAVVVSDEQRHLVRCHILALLLNLQRKRTGGGRARVQASDRAGRARAERPVPPGEAQPSRPAASRGVPTRCIDRCTSQAASQPELLESCSTPGISARGWQSMPPASSKMFSTWK